MKTIIILIIFACTGLLSQNITNTLGTSGLFSIKDGVNTYLSLSQATGNLSLNRSLMLPITTSTGIGVIYKNSSLFLHNYGTDNIFAGINSGNLTMTGIRNSALGNRCLTFNTTGDENTSVGYQSLFSNTTGDKNTAVGSWSMYFNLTGNYNTAVGYQALYFNTDNSNTAVGYQSMYSNTSGSDNSALGLYTLNINTTGSENTAIGFESLFSNTTGNYNTSVGSTAMFNNTSGIYNTAMGFQSLHVNSIGDYITAIGSMSLRRNTGSNNTALGYQSLTDNTTGDNNTAIGSLSLANNTSGQNNTALGYSTGSTLTTGTNNTLIGNNAQPTSGTVSNQITLGNSSITSLRCNVTTITALSDARDKKNITGLSLGLDFITKLKPRQFNWDKREWYDDNISDGSKVQETPTAGFIAQELDEVQTNANAEWLNLVLKDNPEKWEATPGNLLPIMVKAIQDLNSKCGDLKTENDELKEKLAKFEEMQNMLVLEIEKLKSNDIDLKEVKLGEK